MRCASVRAMDVRASEAVAKEAGLYRTGAGYMKRKAAFYGAKRGDNGLCTCGLDGTHVRPSGSQATRTCLLCMYSLLRPQLGSLTELLRDNEPKAEELVAAGGLEPILRLCDPALPERLQEAAADVVCSIACSDSTRAALSEQVR